MLAAVEGSARDMHVVLHVASRLDFGGLETRLEIIAKASARSKFSHYFCAITSGGRTAKQIVAAGNSVTVLGVPSRIPSLRAILGLASLFRRLRPDFVHSHGAEANFHSLMAIALVSKPKPIGICEEIGIPKHSFIARVSFKLLYHFAVTVVAVSRSTMRQVVKLGEVVQTKISIINSPVRAIEFRQARGQTGDSLQLVFVGRLESIKNPLALVDALPILHGKKIQAHLLIIGEGTLEVEIRSRIAFLGIEQFVSIAGYVARPEKLAREADLFVQPSLSEGLSIAMLEAMAAGIPVLTTAEGGGREAIVDGVHGWLLPDVSPQSIAEKIGEIVALPKQSFAQVSVRARSWVQKENTVDGYMESLESLYTKYSHH